MMISPIIFCTIVLGVGSVRKAARVGKVGGLALGYFLAMSTVALAIGLVVGNLLHPGAGLHLSAAAKAAGAKAAAGGSSGTVDFLLGIIPTTLFSALTDRRRCCRRCSSRCWSASRCRRSGRSGEPILRGVEHLQRLVFRILAMIMWLAPIGAFGAIAAVVGAAGWTRWRACCRSWSASTSPA